MSNKIKELRIEQNLTQKQFSDQINIPVTTLAQYERGEREPKLSIWQKLADFFDVTIEYIIGYSPFKKDFIGTLKQSLEDQGFETPERQTGLKDLDSVLKASHVSLSMDDMNNFTSHDAIKLEYILTEYIGLFIHLQKIAMNKAMFTPEESLLASKALVYFSNLLDDIGDTDDIEFLYDMRDKLGIIE
ncbi:helix-turn-helix transcriptional regulator [Leuconostoc gelidum subsp. gasicomitatum]|uniref:helix-turn-helix transcriptional regulator n=1 Tax=Leuconostoc gasicomitatum TaxID=115778 RepID=UPI001CC36ED5|nr:helix-turn-helix transcriptional regulator [Leuconostoc gasicomitatum]MBZ5983624.1 helix-turn-helix transcriptional regulator [Leuconostoc gasicomitatum]